MNKKNKPFQALIIALMFSFAAIPEAQTMQNYLNAKQRAIIPIAAFTANGDLVSLKPVLADRE